MKIINDDSIFREYIFKYIFDSEYVLTDKELIHEKITKMDAPSKYKFELQYLTSNYNGIKKNLITTLKKVYPIILDLHDKNTKLINTNFDILNKPATIDMHVKRWNCDKKLIKNAVVGYSLINKYIRVFNDEFNNLQLLFGINYMEPFIREITYPN